MGPGPGILTYNVDPPRARDPHGSLLGPWPGILTCTPPKNKERGHHAHRKLKQLLVPLCGSVTIDLLDNSGSESYILDSPDDGLFIYGPTWRVLKNFSSDCILMVLASEDFDPDDYIDNYSSFLKEFST